MLGVGGLALGLGAQSLDGLQRLAPLAPAGAAGGERGRAVAIVVEQGAVGAGVEQADRVVLAVHLEQQAAQLLQHAHAHGLVVDEGARAAVGGHLAAQHQVLARLAGHALVGQQRPGAVFGRKVEHGGGHGLGGAVTHQAGVAARARGQAQGVEHDGLARAGLAGERGQASAGLKVQRLDQHHIADVQADQHGCPLSFRC